MKARITLEVSYVQKPIEWSPNHILDKVIERFIKKPYNESTGGNGKRSMYFYFKRKEAAERAMERIVKAPIGDSLTINLIISTTNWENI